MIRFNVGDMQTMNDLQMTLVAGQPGMSGALCHHQLLPHR
jgi:hypothetical protein